MAGTQRSARGQAPARAGWRAAALGGLALGLTLAATGLAYGVLQFVPRVFEARAELLVLPDASGPAEPLSALIAREAGLLASPQLLTRALDRLDQDAWTTLMRAPGLAALPGQLRIEPGAGGMIAVAVRLGEPELAARLADALADAYVAARPGLDPASLLAAGTDAPEDAEAGLRARERLALAERLAGARDRRLTLEARIAHLDGLVAAGNFSAPVPEFEQSVPLRSQLAERARLEAEHAELAIIFLPAHPNMRAVSLRLAEAETQLRAEAGRIVSALRAEVEAQARIEADLATALEASGPAAPVQEPAPVPDIRKLGPALASPEPVFPQTLPVLAGAALLAFCLQLAIWLVLRRRGGVDEDEEEAGEFDEPAPVAPEPARRAAPSTLAAEIEAGRVRVVAVAATGGAEVSEAIIAELVDALSGRSVVLIDAGSGRRGARPGLADLAADRAGFADVVHAEGAPDLAEVPWGRIARLDETSERPALLVGALSSLYEVVIISLGALDARSALPAFAGVIDRLVLAREPGLDAGGVAGLAAALAEAGHAGIVLLDPPGPAHGAGFRAA